MAEFLANDEAVTAAHKHTVYDLIANICHDGQPGVCVLCTSLVHMCMMVCVCRERDISGSCATEGEVVASCCCWL